jgi:hypothetical protein
VVDVGGFSVDGVGECVRAPQFGSHSGGHAKDFGEHRRPGARDAAATTADRHDGKHRRPGARDAATTAAVRAMKIAQG